MNPAITTTNLSHSFGKRNVLRQLSFSVDKGIFFVIIGPNGSGKTTLMKLMAGIIKLQLGQVEILGRSNRGYTPRALARAIAFVPQRLPLDLPFSVRETANVTRAFLNASSEYRRPASSTSELTATAVDAIATRDHRIFRVGIRFVRTEYPGQ